MERRFRVIQGGKQKTGESSGMKLRLYRTYSVGNLTRGEEVFHDVRFNWYCLEREQPVVPYEQLIADYERLDETLRRGLEKDVNKYFTEPEASALSEYLSEKYGLELQSEEIELPLKERGSFFEEGDSVIYDFLELAEREDYSLPFRVWGYYTINNSLSSPSLQHGVMFLKKAFQMLNMTVGFSEEELEEVVKALYANESLLVKEHRETV